MIIIECVYINLYNQSIKEMGGNKDENFFRMR